MEDWYGILMETSFEKYPIALPMRATLKDLQKAAKATVLETDWEVFWTDVESKLRKALWAEVSCAFCLADLPPIPEALTGETGKTVPLLKVDTLPKLLDLKSNYDHSVLLMVAKCFFVRCETICKLYSRPSDWWLRFAIREQVLQMGATNLFYAI